MITANPCCLNKIGLPNLAGCGSAGVHDGRGGGWLEKIGAISAVGVVRSLLIAELSGLLTDLVGSWKINHLAPCADAVLHWEALHFLPLSCFSNDLKKVVAQLLVLRLAILRRGYGGGIRPSGGTAEGGRAPRMGAALHLYPCLARQSQRLNESALYHPNSGRSIIAQSILKALQHQKNRGMSSAENGGGGIGMALSVQNDAPKPANSRAIWASGSLKLGRGLSNPARFRWRKLGKLGWGVNHVN